MEVTMEATKMVRDILTIISRYFGQVFDEDSLNYQRIVTHLQYFALTLFKIKKRMMRRTNFFCIGPRKVS